MPQIGSLVIYPRGMTLAEEAWWLQAACRAMSPKEADSVFFPSSGGKPTKAKQICEECPVVSMCLKRAIESNLSGFLAGTTESERKVMSAYFCVKPVQAEIAELLPEVGKRKVYRKILPHHKDTVEYLNELQEPVFLKD